MTEQIKRLEELTQMDELHALVGQATGTQLNLSKLHECVSAVELHTGVPEAIRGQFNIARNMALYTYFFYALAPELQHKTYTIIEMALREKARKPKNTTLRPLLEIAIKHGWLQDSGFRHIEAPKPHNPYCATLVQTLPRLRNTAAHGSANLSSDCVWHLERCADLVNQLFLNSSRAAPSNSAAA